MIDVILDKNTNNEFCGKEYPLIEINHDIAREWEEYKKIAKKIITENLEKDILIIRVNNQSISLNKLALALFVNSIIIENKIEKIVFKVQDVLETHEQYKPYISLSIAIKYALNLANETAKVVYKNISELGYLGIKTKRDYFNNTMTLSLPNSTSKPIVINSNTLQDTICNVALLKALSLAQADVNIELNIDFNEKDEQINKEAMIRKILKDIYPWIS